MKKKRIAHSIFFSAMLVILIAGLAVAKFYADEASCQPGYSGVDLLPLESHRRRTLSLHCVQNKQSSKHPEEK